MDPEQQWCGNDGCPHFGQVGVGNIKVYSYVERRYYCVTCGQTFNADIGTFLETLRTARSVVLDAVAMLVERSSLRATGRIKHVKPDTVLHWLDLAGQPGAAASDHLICNLHLTQAQVDELWTFVKKSRRTSKQMTHPT